MNIKLVIEKERDHYAATLHAEGKVYGARDLNMFTAAQTAYHIAMADYPGLEFPLLDLMGAFAAINDLEKLCDICKNKGMEMDCHQCDSYSNWSRA